MNWLDLVLAIILAASVFGGFRSGFTKATFGLIATSAGILLGFWFYDVPAAWYSGFIDSKYGGHLLPNVLGFLTVFFAVVIAGTIAGRLFAAMFHAIGLKFADRLAGAIFGFVRGALFATVVVVTLLAVTPRPSPAWMRGSMLLPYALKVSDLAASLAPRAVKTALSKSIDEIKRTWNDDAKLPAPIDQ